VFEQGGAIELRHSLTRAIAIPSLGEVMAPAAAGPSGAMIAIGHYRNPTSHAPVALSLSLTLGAEASSVDVVVWGCDRDGRRNFWRPPGVKVK
jgi:hypothetical protein